MNAGLPFTLLLGLGAACAILLIAIAPFFPRRLPGPQGNAMESDPAFLIRDQHVVDTNGAGHQLIEMAKHDGSALDRLKLSLVRDFDDIDSVTAPASSPGLCLHSRDGALQLTREIIGDAVKLKLRPATGTEPASDEFHRMRAMRSELETLRANTLSAPFLLWRLDEKGQPTWVNQTYLDTIAATFGEDRRFSWPLPSLFPVLATVDPGPEGTRRRLSLKSDETGETHWFDCHVKWIGSDRLITAFRADEAVRADIRRTEFTQTLTKTFSDLAVGLAIFDRARRLVLFNPALTDLTALPSDFLISRPSLASFLDKLRESRMMPEPRDYSEWRRSIADIEAAASKGSYAELWSLPDGQTYRVTGHPHPDGAVALLLEDISAEVSLSRRFREEMQLSQAVMDAFDEAVAVFSGSGEQIVCNAAYRTLWGMPDRGVFLEEDVIAATRAWHEKTVPTPVWGDFRDFVHQGPEREEWSADVSMLDGRKLDCRFLPQPGGATLAMFKLASDESKGGALREVG